MKRQFQRSRV